MSTAPLPPRKQSLLRRLSSGSSSKQRPAPPTEPIPKLPSTPLYESMAKQQPTLPPLIIPGQNGEFRRPARYAILRSSGQAQTDLGQHSRQPVRVRQQAPHPALASPPNSPPRIDQSATQSASMTFSHPPALRSPPSQAGMQNQGYIGNGGVTKPPLYGQRNVQTESAST